LLKTNSIIYSARLVGAIAGVLLILATFLTINMSVYLDKRNEVHRAVMLYDLLFMTHPSKEDFEAYRLKNKLTPVGGEKMDRVRQEGKALIEDELFRKTLQSGDIEIVVYAGRYYYAYKMDVMYYYRSDEPMTPYKVYIMMAFGILVLLLLVLYKYIASSIVPLKDLYVQIQRFADGEKEIHIQVEGDDEVAQVANAFDESVRKTQALEKSRSLFLRNVMHELKTPISKGKLLLHFLKGEGKDKLLLENLFEQMQGHLNDLARVESMTAKNLELNKKTYAAIDVIDHAIDLLDIDRKDLEENLNNELIVVDFNLFAYALKNLLDNAMKYTDSKPIQITFKNDCLTVSNIGAAFKEDFGTYIKAYQRDMSQHSLEGMGLGLYIANEIVTRHGYELRYEYKDTMHHFFICF